MQIRSARRICRQELLLRQWPFRQPTLRKASCNLDTITIGVCAVSAVHFLHASQRYNVIRSDDLSIQIGYKSQTIKSQFRVGVGSAHDGRVR